MLRLGERVRKPTLMRTGRGAMCLWRCPTPLLAHCTCCTNQSPQSQSKTKHPAHLRCLNQLGPLTCAELLEPLLQLLPGDAPATKWWPAQHLGSRRNNFHALVSLMSSFLSLAHCASSRATCMALPNPPFRNNGAVLITLALCLKISMMLTPSKLAIPIATLRALTSRFTGENRTGSSTTSSTSGISPTTEPALEPSLWLQGCTCCPTPNSNGDAESWVRLRLIVSDSVCFSCSLVMTWTSAFSSKTVNRFEKLGKPDLFDSLVQRDLDDRRQSRWVHPLLHDLSCPFGRRHATAGAQQWLVV